MEGIRNALRSSGSESMPSTTSRVPLSPESRMAAPTKRVVSDSQWGGANDRPTFQRQTPHPVYDTHTQRDMNPVESGQGNSGFGTTRTVERVSQSSPFAERSDQKRVELSAPLGQSRSPFQKPLEPYVERSTPVQPSAPWHGQGGGGSAQMPAMFSRPAAVQTGNPFVQYPQMQGQGIRSGPMPMQGGDMWQQLLMRVLFGGM